MADQSQVPEPAPIQELSHRSQWASFAMRKRVWNFQRDVSVLPDPKKGEILPAEETRYPKDTDGTLEKKLRVGIIGAGVSGLFTAMTFDYLKEKYGLDVEYEILEANGEERLGGRLFTYYFKNKIDSEGEVVPPEVGPHDYYDVGAMRFPDIDIMERTFKLFKELGMEFNDQDVKKNRETNPPKPGQLVPYHLNGKNQPMLYNSVQVITDGVKVPTAEAFNITGLPIEIMKSSPDELFSSQIKYYTYLYKTAGPQIFWNSLMHTADHYSVRQYLTQIATYDYNTIEYLETMNFGNRWYDQAFSEAVLESLDFDATARWWCVEEAPSRLRIA
ncbi:hypothetical protein PG997_003281 [Apiospora hydei]|uniref:Amine oxidase domain-containing protein n=1 Tax=Apiospora hydei TaxID=1337664 RepID=A0ABR1WYV5_9PEZI